MTRLQGLYKTFNQTTIELKLPDDVKKSFMEKNF